ncbi:MAG: tRNA (adenosine(37)-N6)-dimethylallyltransferase MiaA [Ignavibacteria bacterium]
MNLKNSTNLRNSIPVIVGPTASGKTDIAYETAVLLRDKLNKEVEIISADSRQVYKYILIASSYPPEKYLKEFKHYYIGALNPEDEFNAGMFGKSARELIKKIIGRNKFPLVAGGSGLYISSLIYGLFDYENINEESDELKQKQKEIRINLEERLKKEGIESLLDELKKVDSESAGKMENVNQRRIVRALEVYFLTGIPISVHQKRKIDVGFSAVQFGINWERQDLYDRINNRVDLMIENGLIAEISKLKSNGYNCTEYNSLNTVGVKEVFDYLDNKISKDEMITLIKQNTRRFAKRQMTWFGKDKNIRWIDADEKNFVKIPKMLCNILIPGEIQQAN